MYIKKLQVFNYKSYYDSGVMEFAPGVNIIVGRNNAGKTSLLEVLTLDFEDQLHKSIKTLPTSSSKITEESRAEISLLFDKEELVNLINQLPHPLGITFPNYNKKEESWNHADPEQQAEVLVKWFQEVLDSPPIELKLSLYGKPQTEGENKIIIEKFFKYDFKSYNPAPKNKNKKISFVPIKYVNENKFFPVFEYYDDEDNYTQTTVCEFFEGNIEQTIDYQIFNIFKKRIYRFEAERLNIGSYKLENITNFELKSDASNLAEVIFILQGKNPGLFSKYNQLVSEILEEIKWISVVPRDNSNVEIIVWTTDPKDPKLNRDDLSFPLSSCGSGVSQVLAIVYILVSSIHEPRTIIIDEPQSFLHPGAARKLIETIKQFPQHQYFIATHSPDIITTADPSNIIKLKYENCQTTASRIDTKNIKSQKEILTELGVRLSDVFGADSVLWVEGPTEEKCFPLIIGKFLAEMPLKGMNILSVKSTDALLDGKHSSLVADIYDKLKSGISLIPEESIFIFDKENKTDKQIEDLKRIGFKFLELPMYENYILNPNAISAIINEEATWLESPITIDEIKEYLKLDNIKNIEEKEKLFPGVKLEEVSDDNWLSKVHGANLLKNLFQNFCGTLLEFKKTTHSPSITEWIIKNQPEFLSKLAKELKECLSQHN
jgi:AAA15 family ATPase/GTPase